MYSVKVTASSSPGKYDVEVERHERGGVFLYSDTISNDTKSVNKIISDIEKAYRKWVDKESPIGLLKEAIEDGLK